MNKVNVLQLMTTSNVRGTENLIINYVEKSNTELFENYICTLHPVGALHEYAKNKKITALLSLGTKYNIILASFRLIKLIKKYKISVIHVYGFRTDLICRITLPFTNVRVLISAIHSVYESSPKILHLIDKLLSPVVDLYISNSKRGTVFYQTRTNISVEKYCTIPSGVDIGKFKKSPKKIFRKKHRIPEDSILISMLAGITGQKGHDTAIEALDSVLREQNGIDCRLVLMGKDYTGGSILRMVEQKGLSEKVYMLGFCDDDEMHDVFNSTDIFILPSLREGLPTVILEAMSYSIPVIASKVGGIPELIQDGKTGYLIPPGDLIKLKDRLILLINDPQKRKQMGNQGRKLVESQFSLDDMVCSIENKYLELFHSKYSQ